MSSENFISISLAAAVFASTALLVPDDAEVSAEIAIEAALDQFRDTEQPKSQCSNCRGTGKIGDGRVTYECPVCKGTGKSACESGSCRIN